MMAIYGVRGVGLRVGNKVKFHNHPPPSDFPPSEATIISFHDDGECAVIETRTGVRISVYISALSRAPDDSWYDFGDRSQRSASRDWLQCPRCRKVSYSPHDINTGWCDVCQDYSAKEEAETSIHEGDRG
jgi:hypothetical protein